MSFPPLFTLIPDVRPLCCGSRVGMAMVAQTCRWARQEWRHRRPAKTVPLIEAVAMEGDVALMRALLWSETAHYDDTTLLRCAIHAMHAGEEQIFADVLVEMRVDRQRENAFEPFCLATGRELLLSRTLDVVNWIGTRGQICWPLVRSAYYKNDVDVFLHAGGGTIVSLGHCFSEINACYGGWSQAHRVPRQFDHMVFEVIQHFRCDEALAVRALRLTRGDLDEVTHILTALDPDRVCRVMERAIHCHALDALGALILAHDDEDAAVTTLIKT